MIEIKCSKAAYERIVTALTVADECVFGKSYYTCYASKEKAKYFNCAECVRKNIKRISKNEKLSNSN